MLRIIVVFKEGKAKLSIVECNNALQMELIFIFVSLTLSACTDVGNCAELFIFNYFSAFGHIIDSERHKLHFVLSLSVLALTGTLLCKCNILILWGYKRVE